MICNMQIRLGQRLNVITYCTARKLLNTLAIYRTSQSGNCEERELHGAVGSAVRRFYTVSTDVRDTAMVKKVQFDVKGDKGRRGEEF